MSELLKIDKDYAQWIEEISHNFKKFQIKASASVNVEMLKFYWTIGEGINEKIKKVKQSEDFYSNLSNDLTAKIPNVKGFSRRNLHYMRQFYQMFSNMQVLPQVETKSNSDINMPQAVAKSDKRTNVPQVVARDDFDNLMVFCIPWGHIRIIIDKCKNDKGRAIFYIKETIENNWSRAVLLNFIDTDLYERKGKAINNFDKNLPDVNSDLAKEMTRDPYCFDFISIREKYDEKELKDALMDNIQKFLLELGSGFSFVGREYRLKVGETEQFLDMLFYNIKLKCYVVIEVKVRDFKPEDMGQLSTYISCVNHILKNDSDNQTIGILICKNKDNVLAKYAVETQNEPVAISEYELSKLFPKNFKSSMPTIEEIERELK